MGASVFCENISVLKGAFVTFYMLPWTIPSKKKQNEKHFAFETADPHWVGGKIEK